MRRQPVRIAQAGLSSALLVQAAPSNRYRTTTKDVVAIELCDLPRVISELKEIWSRVEIAHRPDITGICKVCGNECYSANQYMEDTE